MKPVQRLGFGFALGIAAACGHSAEPALYALSPVAGHAVTSSGSRVKLLRVGLPGYLDREVIVRGVREHRLEVAAGEHWSEPLAAMLTRVLVEDLAGRLPNARVFAEGSALDVQANALVNVQVEQFELVGERAVLRAQVTVCNEGCAASQMERVNLVDSIEAHSTSAMVAAEERLLGNLADCIVRMITR